MSNRVCMKKWLLTAMGTHIVNFLTKHKQQQAFCVSIRSKTTSIQYVESRARDPTFEKLMDKYKNLLKVIAVQDLILANPKNQSVSIEFLSNLSQKLHLNRGATAFLRKFPHIFLIYYEPSKLQPFCRLTDAALDVSRHEAEVINASLPLVVERLVRILTMSASKTVPLRAIFKVWRELGLPDDFEDSVISANSSVFQLCDADEPNTHLLKLVADVPSNGFRAAVEDWRVVECCKEECSVDRMEMRFSFKHGYPPGMRLTKNFRAKVKEWQSLPYVGPYEMVSEKKKLSKAGMMAMEKRAVSIVHEFLSLTVEKMVEVEKISQFRKWFGIDLNIRDLFLDHPGIFYLSTKGKRHTVFLREAYERGCLIQPNPVYEARRKLLDLVALERRGLRAVNSKLQDRSSSNEVEQKDSMQRDDSLSSFD
ncbi:protein ROOT PRIMORDIUM DEFECTIVE 1 isoform X1 [Cicer arietinum]|uniref:Protein ROOT PRIMORDIUM DEFECTIVE 1 isoform X1 n=1 Tax=Cicer arietinum TaxID=3827 RepID=A0A1S2Y701_CICAR|nr:protein ROOT PRIMORDIUM DEFECTIVE 1 isoform X1 [Cicer arietinum]